MEFTAILAPPAHGGGADDSGRDRAAAVEKERMFEKVVTPSDVGKLNRLVIPKQHAERYFPLDGAAGTKENGGKGMVLSFEDRGGKVWRFRYSYWNSSQSYVMTKGWSRFVKEKRLGAGDTVSFCRGVGETARGRLFIDFRRRLQDDSAVVFPPLAAPSQRLPLPPVPLCPWRRDYSNYGHGTVEGSANRHVLFLRQQVPAAVVLKSMPVRPAAAEATRQKRVRLFGVNLDCGATEDGQDGGGSVTQTAVSSTLLHLPSPSPSSSMAGKKEMCSLDLGL